MVLNKSGALPANRVFGRWSLDMLPAVMEYSCQSTSVLLPAARNPYYYSSGSRANH
ncbi:MAG TPA: hypothetical protein VFV34_04470 [Blastocatellia bacterium]|nr:hypothetical protein [Blastocatellia bacterium]